MKSRGLIGGSKEIGFVPVLYLSCREANNLTYFASTEKKFIRNHVPPPLVGREIG
jgi:hypothetical protein